MCQAVSLRKHGKRQQNCQEEEAVFCQTYLETSCNLHESVVVDIPLPLLKSESVGKQQAWPDLCILEIRALSFSSKTHFLHMK